MIILQPKIMSVNLKVLQTAVLCSLVVLNAATVALGNDWEPVTGVETLQRFMGGMKAERKLPNEPVG